MSFKHFSRRLLVVTLIAAPIVTALAVAGVVATGEDPPSQESPLGIPPSEATRITDPEKQDVWEREYNNDLTAAASTPPAHGTPYVPPFETPVPAPTGILPGGNPVKPFIFNNVWSGYEGGERVAVYAGYDTRDGVGVLYIQRQSGETDWTKVDGSGGALSITAADDDGTLELTSDTGTTYTFELSAMTLSSPTPAIAIGTPAPVPTVP